MKWTDELSAWSGGVSALLALTGGFVAVLAARAAWKALELQRKQVTDQSNQLRMIDEDRRTAAASRFAMWIIQAKDNEADFAVEYRNANDLPVYDITLTVYKIDAVLCQEPLKILPPTAGVTALPDISSSIKKALHDSLRKAVIVSGSDDPAGKGFGYTKAWVHELSIEVTFRDAQNRRWKRLRDGRLKRDNSVLAAQPSPRRNADRRSRR